MRLLFLLSLLALATPAQNEPHSPAPDEKKREESKYIGVPAAIEAGKELFVGICSACHGPNGEGGRGPNLIDGENIRHATNEQLFNSIKNGVPGGDMPPLPLPDEQIWQVVAFVRSLSAPAYLQQVPGDPEAGKALFFGKAGCKQCHTIRGQGGHLGPDLSSIGGSRNINRLRQALLDPNARLTPGFTPIRVTTQDGQQLWGVAKNYSNYSYQILDAEGRLFLLSSRQVQEVVFPAKTWMPDDYGRRLTADEIRDLLAFLSRQAVRVPAPDRKEDR